MNNLKLYVVAAVVFLSAILLNPIAAYASGGDDVAGAALIFLVVVFVVFLILRELMCWYWKINHIVALLTEIRDNLKGKE